MIVQLQAIFDDLDDASSLLKVMAGRHRFALAMALLNGEMTVTALARATGNRETASSQQLSILREAGIVTTRREGQRIYYSLTSPEARQVLQSMLDILRKQSRDHVEPD